MTTKPKCFVIMPFGNNETNRTHYTVVYERIIKPPVEAAGFECERGDEIPEYGPIPEQITQKLASADLVVADLSGRNPNVFYELGYRRALKKAIIPIADDLDNLPFDVATYRTILYRADDLEVAGKCSDTIKDHASRVRRTLSARRPSQAEEQLAPTLLELDYKLSTGFANVYQLIGEIAPVSSGSSLSGEIADLGRRVDDQIRLFKEIGQSISELGHASRLIAQTAEMGLMSIYPNRLEAIENEFYQTMREESSGISIVGSTIFGLRGYRNVQLSNIVNVLQEKARKPEFELRLLLTHWDFISYRQDQEKTEKNIARYVISKELKQAVDLLRETGLEKTVKFYKGSPTCFTILCEGQKVMLVNPYPYEREAFNSWTVVFREASQGIFTSFKSAHIDQPWKNEQLTVPWSIDCESAIMERFRDDVSRAPEELKKELGAADEEAGY